MLDRYFINVFVTALIALLYFGAVGGALGSRLLRGLPAPVRWLASPILGQAVWTGVTLIVLQRAQFSNRNIGLLAGLVLSASLACARAPRMRTLRGLIPMFLGAAAIACLPLLTIMPHEYERGLFFGLPAYDHMKVAVVDSIYRHGLPPVSPYYATEGHSVPLNYYFGWFASAATLRIIPGVTGLPADAALTWCTAWGSLLLMAGLAVFLTGKHRAGYLALLVAIPCGLEDPLSWTFGSVYSEWISRDHGLEPWLVQASWVPQHMFAGAIVLLIVLLLAELFHTKQSRWPIALCVGLLAGTAIVSSIWVGVFSLGCAAAFMLVAVVSTRRALVTFPRVGLALGLATIPAALVVWPFVRTVQALRKDVGSSPIDFWMFPTLEGAHCDSTASCAKIGAFFWTIYLCIQLGIIYWGGWCGLFRKNLASPERTVLFRRLSIAVVIADLGVAQFVRSTLGNNDLGWRAILPAVLLLVTWTAVAASHWLDALRTGLSKGGYPAFFGLIMLTLVGSLGTVSSAHFVSDVFRVRERDPAALSLRRDLRKQAEAWEAVRRLTTPQDLVATNPKTFENVAGWVTNVPVSLLSDRSTLLSDAFWSHILSHQVDREILDRDLQFIDTFFNHTPTEEDVARMAEDCGVQGILVGPRDHLWNNGVLEQSRHYELAVETTDYRVFLRRRTPGVPLSQNASAPGPSTMQPKRRGKQP